MMNCFGFGFFGAKLNVVPFHVRAAGRRVVVKWEFSFAQAGPGGRKEDVGKQDGGGTKC